MKTIFVVLIIHLVFIFILALISAFLLKTVFAIILITIAFALPLRQKRFSIYSIFLIFSGVLFLLSGLIDDAYQTIVEPLSVQEQIEFSKIIRPMQVSSGLRNVGAGICNAILAQVFLNGFKNIPPRSKVMKLAPLILYIFAVLYLILGLSSIVNGLSKL